MTQAQTMLELVDEISRVTMHDAGRNYALLDLLQRTEKALRATTAAAQPVAWRWRWASQDWWHLVLEKPLSIDGVTAFCEPLYATPSPLPAPGEQESMVRLSASEVACYRWPEDTAEHRAMRAAFMDGAAFDAALSPPPASGDGG